jgi:hypothetical protein
MCTYVYPSIHTCDTCVSYHTYMNVQKFVEGQVCVHVFIQAYIHGTCVYLSIRTWDMCVSKHTYMKLYMYTCANLIEGQVCVHMCIQAYIHGKYEYQAYIHETVYVHVQILHEGRQDLVQGQVCVHTYVCDGSCTRTQV